MKQDRSRPPTSIQLNHLGLQASCESLGPHLIMATGIIGIKKLRRTWRISVCRWLKQQSSPRLERCLKINNDGTCGIRTLCRVLCVGMLFKTAALENRRTSTCSDDVVIMWRGIPTWTSFTIFSLVPGFIKARHALL